jgi:hypothetical protein
MEERQLSPFRPHLTQDEHILEWTRARTVHGQDGTRAVTDRRLFWCDEPLDAEAVEIVDYRRIYAVGANRQKCLLTVRTIRDGLLDNELASGDIYDDYAWQLMPKPTVTTAIGHHGYWHEGCGDA